METPEDLQAQLKLAPSTGPAPYPGIVFRLQFDPEPDTLFLTNAEPPYIWSTDPDKAHPFDTYADAQEKATQLRAEGIAHIHADERKPIPPKHQTPPVHPVHPVQQTQCHSGIGAVHPSRTGMAAFADWQASHEN